VTGRSCAPASTCTARGACSRLHPRNDLRSTLGTIKGLVATSDRDAAIKPLIVARRLPRHGAAALQETTGTPANHGGGKTCGGWGVRVSDAPRRARAARCSATNPGTPDVALVPGTPSLDGGSSHSFLPGHRRTRGGKRTSGDGSSPSLRAESRSTSRCPALRRKAPAIPSG
jgi:hypothetical protein